MNCNWRNRFKLSPKEGLTVSADITVKARTVDFITRFAKNWDALREILGITRPIKKQPGTVLVSSKASIVLASGDVGEGEEVPYSEAKVEPVAYADLKLRKYVKAVSVEAVAQYGAAVAIQKTDDAFLNELQGVVMTEFYEFLTTGQLVDNQGTFQMAVAMAIGDAKDKFKKMHRDGSRVVVWVNTLDAYQELGASAITVQNQFGIDYIKNYLGADTIILSSEMPRGFVFATPVDNIVNYYIDPSDQDIRALGLDFTTQGETNFIGFHANGNYNTFVGESQAIMGFVLWCEFIDAMVVMSINGMTKVRINPTNGVTVDPDTGTLELAMLTTDDPVQLSTKTIPYNATITWTSSDSNVATVSGGKITAQGAGTATITAATGSSSGADSATLTVTVTAPE